MWIGTPGAMRQIKDGAASFDRSPDVTATEFRALTGGITTWAPPVQPRRLKMTWAAMDPADYYHIDRMARGYDRTQPLVVLDPLTRNELSGPQGAGVGDPTNRWSYGAAITLFGGISGAKTPNTVSVTSVPPGGVTELVWRHPIYHGFPVIGGQTYTFWAPDLVAGSASTNGASIAWYNSSPAYISSSVAATPTAPVVAQAPANALYGRPLIGFKTTGNFPLGYSLYGMGDHRELLLSGVRPTGEGARQYEVTAYRQGAHQSNGLYRDVSLELVEVTNNATG